MYQISFKIYEEIRIFWLIDDNDPTLFAEFIVHNFSALYWRFPIQSTLPFPQHIQTGRRLSNLAKK